VPLEVLRGQRLDQAALLDVEMNEGLEVVGQGPGLVAGPGVEGGHELGLVDQADLEGQQAEEEVAVCVDGHRVCPRATVRGRDDQHFAPASRVGPVVTADQSYNRILDLAIQLPARPVRVAQPIAAAPPSPLGPGLPLDAISARVNGRPESIHCRPRRIPGLRSLSRMFAAPP
jgi:hypothetical protein